MVTTLSLPAPHSFPTTPHTRLCVTNLGGISRVSFGTFQADKRAIFPILPSIGIASIADTFYFFFLFVPFPLFSIVATASICICNLLCFPRKKSPSQFTVTSARCCICFIILPSDFGRFLLRQQMEMRMQR